MKGCIRLPYKNKFPHNFAFLSHFEEKRRLIFKKIRKEIYTFDILAITQMCYNPKGSFKRKCE
ncbi:hypothetical protein GCM10011389_17890 [Pontibacillus salipaludis]|uniref:Uncharacterized protein n=1 Tax=Pontibacillus salipaludis TaxID=1697394 RepID=A0ABQ1Q358_9BACI|nr:hypothetical protein GCM10011389_17890 [Pontibacillus salipaludis]